MAWALDLDGVVWLAETPIPGAADAVAELQAAGETVGFVTNNSSVPRAAVAAKLAGIGIDPGDGVITSAMAAARLVEPGSRALVCAGAGVVDELTRREVEVVREGGADIDVVVVGFHRDFDWERMRIAAGAVRAGARLLATNDDATYPTPDGPVPGCGAILASIVTASGVEPEIAGKPHRAMVDLVRDRLGTVGTMVGDRPDTDGEFAVALGYRFALVLTGVTAAADLPVVPVPDLVAPSLLDVVRTSHAFG